MAQVEVWLENGRGIFGKIQNLRPPMVVTVLKDQQNQLLPIYENHNEVSPGKYEVLLYDPYNTNEKTKSVGFLNVYPDITLERIILWYNMGELSALQHAIGASSQDKKDELWQKRIKEKGDRMSRPIGWREDQAVRMLNY